jgi:hypothetical protein
MVVVVDGVVEGRSQGSVEDDLKGVWWGRGCFFKTAAARDAGNLSLAIYHATRRKPPKQDSVE